MLAEKLFRDQKIALAALFLLAFVPGLIQSAHFGTTESILTFTALALTYLSILVSEKGSGWALFLSALVGAVGLAAKVNAVLFFFPILFGFLFHLRQEKRKVGWLVKGVGFILLLAGLTFLFSPYYFISWREAFSTISYEARIASGQAGVFYTRQFINTRPFLFQLMKIFPWLLGLPAFVVFLAAAVTGLVDLVREKRLLVRDKRWLLFHFSWLPWLFFNAFLFAKWVRFMVPLLPFLAIVIVHFLYRQKVFRSSFLFFCLLTLLALPGLVFFKIYLGPDIRQQASFWLENNLPSGAVVLSEAGNVVDLPLVNKNNLKVTNFHFYQLDENLTLQEKLPELTKKADYFLSPSRRIFTNHSRLPEQFPQTAEFYDRLFSGQSGFVLLKEFKVFDGWEEWLLGSDLNSEETWTVFDHPTIRIYKRV